MVSVTIVTWNSTTHLQRLFDSLKSQDFTGLEVVIVDNASTDGTRQKLTSAEPSWRVILNETNIGFAAGQNQAIRASKGDWVLCLNPDVLLSPDFIGKLVEAGERHPEAGGICGKLLRLQESADADAIIDSAGIYFTDNMRHLDRGSEEIDRGQYEREQYVFGATGAAVLFRRAFIEQVSVQGEFFDEEFFAYREDADLAWRAQLMGWKYVYTPAAVAWHVRRVTPERRSELPLEVNWHSVKNRWLMRAKNASGWLCWRLLLPTLTRDLLVWGYSLLRDRRMLSACWYRWRPEVRERVKRKRAWIQSRRRISDRDLIWWFSNTPREIDVPTISLAISNSGALGGRATVTSGEPR